MLGHFSAKLVAVVVVLSLLKEYVTFRLKFKVRGSHATHGHLAINMGILQDLNAKLLMENAERLGRIEQSLIGKKTPMVAMKAIPLNTAMTKTLKDSELLSKAILLRDGCVSIKNVISSETADALLKTVNQMKIDNELAVEKGDIIYDEYFGAVNNRRMRADMFLPYSNSIVQQAILEAILNLEPFLHSLQDMSESGFLHELSCIISDPGSPTQCVHCDTPWLPKVSPLYTFFIALQDVEDNMGHTTYLPKTHVEDAHRIFNAGIKQKENLIELVAPSRSDLKKGDVAIFDSRVLHAGGANTSNTRRVLFYFTFTSGDVKKYNPNPSRGYGSIRIEDRDVHTLKSLLVPKSRIIKSN